MLTLETIDQTIKENPAVMLYFSAPDCGVCGVLKPKLFEAVTSEFDQFETVNIDISVIPEAGAHFGVFAAPTVIVYLDGREFLRKSRNMSVGEVIEEIRRPYEIMMS
ncbi:MAG: thioredoxin family protein [Sulfurimonadaceae bacterium]|nr:thioredoxin family protein [Sulfurimonadaceae bacterium]